MFACLEIIRQTPHGILDKARWLFKKPWAQLSAGSAFGAEYPVVTAYVTGRGAPLREIAALLPTRTSCLLVPEEEAALAQSLGFPGVKGNAFHTQLLLESACLLASGSRLPMYRRALGLLDPDGSHAWMLGKLLRHYVSVRVVSDNADVYENAAEQMMEQLGAPVILGDRLTNFADCALLLCPGPVTEKLPLLPSCPVLAGDTFADEEGCNVLSAPHIATESGLVPLGIDAQLFAAALYEYHDVALSNFQLESFQLRGQRIRLAQAETLMQSQAGYGNRKASSKNKGGEF